MPASKAATVHTLTNTRREPGWPFRSLTDSLSCSGEQRECDLTAVLSIADMLTVHMSELKLSAQLIWAVNIMLTGQNLTFALQRNSGTTVRKCCSTLTGFKRYSYNWVVNRYGRKFWLGSWVANNKIYTSYKRKFAEDSREPGPKKMQSISCFPKKKKLY